MTIKIATFNIWKDCGDFPNRIFKISKYLKDIDVICLQEDFHSIKFSSSDEINKDLELFKTTLLTRVKTRNNILSSSNLTILSKSKLYLEKNLILNKNLDERATQILSFKLDNHKVLIVNTHLTNLGFDYRCEHINKILEKVNQIKCDFIFICGDMNALEYSQEIAMFLNDGFKSINKKPTYSDNMTLDYIFFKSKNIKKEPTIKSKIIDENLSDHYCLINEFQW